MVVEVTTESTMLVSYGVDAVSAELLSCRMEPEGISDGVCGGPGPGIVDDKNHLELTGCPPGSHSTVTRAWACWTWEGILRLSG
jgi:hypothetical protein